MDAMSVFVSNLFTLLRKLYAGKDKNHICRKGHKSHLSIQQLLLIQITLVLLNNQLLILLVPNSKKIVRILILLTLKQEATLVANDVSGVVKCTSMDPECISFINCGTEILHFLFDTCGQSVRMCRPSIPV